MYHDNPDSYVLEKIKEMLYQKPFNISITGDLKSVAGLSRQEVIELFNSIYSTNNMIFSVVGNAGLNEVLEQAKKFPKTKKEIKNIPIMIKNGEIIEKRKGIDQAHLVLGFHMPRLIDKQRYAAELFDSVLGGGMSSKLFQEIREKRGLCYAIKSSLEQSKDYSYEMIYVGTVKEKVKKIKELILKEIKNFNNLNKSDFDEGKERLIGLREVNEEKSDMTMIGLLQEEIGGNAEEFYKYEEKINSVKLQDVKNISKLKGYSFVALVPN
jgi:predicted Zn-dependent peptidase